MLKKLLKNDMRKMKTLWLVYAIILPLLALSFAFSCRYLGDTEIVHGEFLNTLLIVFSSFGAIGGGCIIAAAVVDTVYLAKNMGRDFFSDVGQLTFTLPIKRDHLLLSKFFNSLIWISISNASIIATVLLGMLIIPAPETGYINTVVFDEIGFFLADGFLNGGPCFYLCVILILTIALEINVTMPSLLNYCVIKCSSSGGMGMYIGLMFAGIFAPMIFWAIGTNGASLIFAEMSDVTFSVIAVLYLLFISIGLAILNFALFFSARDRLKYNLNLS